MRLAITATPNAAPTAPVLLRGPITDAFALAELLGYDGVELHLRHPSDGNAADIKRLMQTHRLGVPTLGTGMAAGMDGLTFASPDPTIRQQALHRMMGHITLAAEIGSAVTVGLIWGRLTTDERQRQERLTYALDCLAMCCRWAERAGVTLLLEAINRYESDGPNTLAQALDIATMIGSPHLKLLADTYHMNIEEADMAVALRQVGHHLAHVHLVDNDRLAPGYGHLNLGGLVQTLHVMGYCGYLAFEVLPKPDGQTAAAHAVRTVRSYQLHGAA